MDFFALALMLLVTVGFMRMITGPALKVGELVRVDNQFAHVIDIEQGFVDTDVKVAFIHGGFGIYDYGDIDRMKTRFTP